jgi:catechol 2,3-dioxygenase-like lactoylglutathione lyase family enzyme
MAKPDLVGITVKSMPAALTFYRLLGLEIPEEAGLESHVEYKTGGGFRIAWDTLEIIKPLQPDWIEPRGHRMGLAFLCGSPDEVDSLYAKVTGAGYQGYKEPWDVFWGQRYAIVQDPDGNLIDLFANLES